MILPSYSISITRKVESFFAASDLFGPAKPFAAAQRKRTRQFALPPVAPRLCPTGRDHCAVVLYDGHQGMSTRRCSAQSLGPLVSFATKRVVGNPHGSTHEALLTALWCDFLGTGLSSCWDHQNWHSRPRQDEASLWAVQCASRTVWLGTRSNGGWGYAKMLYILRQLKVLIHECQQPWVSKMVIILKHTFSL